MEKTNLSELIVELVSCYGRILSLCIVHSYKSFYFLIISAIRILEHNFKWAIGCPSLNEHFAVLKPQILGLKLASIYSFVLSSALSNIKPEGYIYGLWSSVDLILMKMMTMQLAPQF